MERAGATEVGAARGSEPTCSTMDAIGDLERRATRKGERAPRAPGLTSHPLLPAIAAASLTCLTWVPSNGNLLRTLLCCSLRCISLSSSLSGRIQGRSSRMDQERGRCSVELAKCLGVLCWQHARPALRCRSHVPLTQERRPSTTRNLV